MAKVIGVKFKNSGKSYFFDPVNFDVHKDDHVIVETGKGVDYGFVVSDVREIPDEKLYQPLKPILRKANERDEEQVAENHVKEKEAFRICQEKVHEHNLDMKLTEAEYAFDNSKILFYFTADGYVDFRELVKDLAAIFRTRIELRQIGVRDEARALGGLGACGRPMCCATYLADFVPVSIKMAKEQNLPLNPTKISGVCGRLMCCLKNEEDTYEELNKTMPSVGDIVEGNDGLQGEVFSTNVLRQLVKVLVEEGDEKELHEYEAGQITVIRRRKGKKNTVINNEENVDEKSLEALEDKPESSDGQEKKEGKRDRDRNREGRQNQGRQENGEVSRRDDRNKNDNEGKSDNRNSGERKSDNRNRQGGEGRSENRNRNDSEGRSENRNRNDGEGRAENRNKQGGEGRSENRNKQGGEGKSENRNSGEAKPENRSRHDGENGSSGENAREFSRKKHGRNFDRKNSENSGKAAETAANDISQQTVSEENQQKGAENGGHDNKFHGKKHYGKYHGHNRNGQNNGGQNNGSNQNNAGQNNGSQQ